MATASASGPAAALGGDERRTKRVLPVLVLPVLCAAAALLVAALFGNLQIGLLLAGGVALGAANGLLMESALARMTPEASPARSAIVKGSLGRLGLITVVALAIAFFARPNGWVLLLGLAAYQLLALAAALGAAAKQARLG